MLPVPFWGVASEHLGRTGRDHAAHAGGDHLARTGVSAEQSGGPEHFVAVPSRKCRLGRGYGVNARGGPPNLRGGVGSFLEAR